MMITDFDKINCVLSHMRELAKDDMYFDIAVMQYENASEVEKVSMNNMLLNIYNDHEDTGIDIETLIELSAYGA